MKLNKFYRSLAAMKGVSNGRVLRLVSRENCSVALDRKILTVAYLRYLANIGSASSLAPIVLSAPAKEALKAAYSGEAKKYDLEWIGSLRRRHNLSSCPFCGSSIAIQLEHFLPKAHYPEFGLLSWNLVPTCPLCNGKRGSFQNNPGAFIRLVHPYFEGILQSRPVLTCSGEVIGDILVFKPRLRTVRRPGVLASRLEHHYGKCLEEDQFNNSLQGAWRRLVVEYSAFKSGKSLFSFLRIKLKSARIGAGINSWEAALCRGVWCDEKLATELSQSAKWKIQ